MNNSIIENISNMIKCCCLRKPSKLNESLIKLSDLPSITNNNLYLYKSKEIVEGLSPPPCISKTQLKLVINHELESEDDVTFDESEDAVITNKLEPFGEIITNKLEPFGESITGNAMQYNDIDFYNNDNDTYNILKKNDFKNIIY